MPTTSTWLLTTLVACKGSGETSESPSLSVEGALAFDDVDIRSDEPRVETVWVENVGDGLLTVEAPYFAEDGAFTVSGEPVTLERMEVHGYDVTFDPQTPFVHEASLVLESNDPAMPVQEVTVRGEAFAPVLEVSTSRIDVEALVGCAADAEVELTNGGNEALVVTPSFAGTSKGELSLPADGTPYEIEPGGSAIIAVAYTPVDTYADSATLALESNDPLLPATEIAVRGEAQVMDRQTDLFDVNARASDIVLVVDNSESMDTEQSQLVDHIGAFVAELDDSAADYRIGVITTDNSGFRGNVVTPGDPLASLADQVEAGTEGSGTERALQMLYNCTQPGADCSASADFLRDDALFVGIIIADDPDQSALTPEGYVEYFSALKGDPALVRIHAFAGAIPVPTCSTCASAGFGYDEAVELTDGEYVDICTDDWDVALRTIADRSVLDPQSSVRLSADPVDSSIAVFVDGAPTGGWSYTGHVADGGTNEIEFPDPLPVPSVVSVSYDVTAVCE